MYTFIANFAGTAKEYFPDNEPNETSLSLFKNFLIENYLKYQVEEEEEKKKKKKKKEKER